MKKKIVKVSSHKEMTKKLAGVGTFRVTGGDARTGERMVLWVKGTRQDAETVEIDSSKYHNNEVINFGGDDAS